MHLSPRGLWLASLSLLAGIVAQWLPGGPYAQWLLLPALLLIAVLLEAANARALRIRADWQLPASLYLGRDTALPLDLHCTTPRRQVCDIVVAPAAGSRGAVLKQRGAWAAHGAALSLSVRFSPQQLGGLALPDVHLRLRGLFGLAWWSRRPSAPSAHLDVMPDVPLLQQAASGLHRASGVAVARHGQGSESLSLREYHSGDPLRLLAWKASARRGKLMVRELAEEQQLDILFIIDSGRAGRQPIGALTRLHHAVNASARLAEHAVAAGDHVGLLAYDSQGLRAALAPARGLHSRQRLHLALAALRATAGDSDPLLAAAAAQRYCRRRALILWFTDVDSGASTQTLQDAARLLRPRHLPLFAGLVDQALPALLTAPGDDWFAPYRSLAAAQALDAAAAQAQQLRRQGCRVVSAAPADIDERLLQEYQALRAQRRV